MVGLGRLELPTSPLSGVRSNQLSYRPIICLVTDTTGLHNRSSLLDKTICVNTYEIFVILVCKEVIQPQVPLRLPCYDFTPVIDHTVVTAQC